jgi:ribosome-associated toxin RatA of RatAB toxin-antitoxin module
MIRIERSALVTFTTKQMFDLVNDIESYPEFMQGCQYARVIERTDELLVGELTLGKAGLKQSFTTSNKLTPYTDIEMHLVEGPFKQFSAAWHFKALTDSACKVSLQMEFVYAGLVGMVLEKVFEHSANTLVDAVIDRAHQVYDQPVRP